MSSGLKFDEETSRRVEVVYLTPEVVAQRCHLLKALKLTEGERVLDIGSGPGLLAFEMAAAVGPAGRVCGIDISEDMLASRKGGASNRLGPNFIGQTPQNCPFRITALMLPQRLRSTNTLRTSRRLWPNSIESCVQAVGR
jgi:SAM-dependent methyltransferase